MLNIKSHGTTRFIIKFQMYCWCLMICLIGNLNYQNCCQYLLQCLCKYHLFLCIPWSNCDTIMQSIHYPYNTIMLSWFYIFIPNLIHYYDTKLTVLNRQLYSCIFEFFYVYSKDILCEKLCSMIVWCWY